MKKILFIRSDRFGEFLLSLPAIKLVRINYPQSIFFLLAQKNNIELIKGIDFIDHFLEYKTDLFSGYKGAFYLASILKKEKFDCVIILNPKKEFHLASFLAKVPIRVGYDRKWGFCLNKKIKDRKYLQDKHEVEYNMDLVSLICKDRLRPGIDIPIDEEDSLDFLKNIIGLNRKYFVIHTFSSNPLKKIDYEFWKTLILRLRNKFKDDIILIGERNEEEEGRILEERLGIKSIVGRLSLRNLATFLKYYCKVFIGLDSGPMHLASFLGIPTVGLFKSSSSDRWAPFGKEILLVRGQYTNDFLGKIEDIASFISKGQ
jgi:ADP-heptose:LPS heptosyltransferase